jgi:outer membrane protein insertion porin family
MSQSRLFGDSREGSGGRETGMKVGWRRWTAKALLLGASLCPMAALAAMPEQGAAGAPGDSAVPAAPEQASRAQPIPSSALPDGGSALMGQIVEQIHFVAPLSYDPSAWREKIPLREGDRLERGKLRESLRILYRSGLFSEIVVDGARLPSGGVALEFWTTPRYFNGSVQATGLPKGGPSESEVLSTGRLELGAQFTNAKLKDAESRILRLMHDAGYWMASVDAELLHHEQTQQVDVEYQIVPGPRARVGKLTVTGDSTLSPEKAESVCGIHPGKKVRAKLLQRALSRLRKRYVKERRLRAQFTAERPVFHPESNTVDYSIAVEPGPEVEISVEGFKLSRGKLKRYVPVWEEHAVDEDLLNEGRRNLRDYLQSQGYFDAVVQVREEENEDHTKQQIVYSIRPGERRTLKAIEIVGNSRFSTATLRERMGTEVAGVLLSYGRFSESQLSSDLDAIRGLYKANGYLKVKVSSELIERYEGVAGDFKLVVRVEEGPLVRVGKLEIFGAHTMSELQLRRLINTQPGQPFSESTVADDREAVLNEYFNRGFLEVQMETTAKYSDASESTMDVAYEIHEGPQNFVRQVVVSGVEHTRPKVVQRELVIHEGAPLSQEKILLSQRNLYDLGVFNEIRTAIQNPEGDAVRKNVLFQIKEARRWTIDYGGGIEIATGLNLSQGGSPQGETGVSPRVIFNLTRINFRGRAQSLIFKSHFGNLQKRAALSLDQPHWLDLRNWRMTLTGLYDNARDVNTFSSSRVEGSVQLTQQVTKATQLLYRYSIRRIEVDPTSFPAGFSPSLIDLYSQPVRVGMPSLTFLRDRRDNPVNSTKGSYITFDIGLADSVFGSQANFGRVLAQYATYHKIFRGWVLARSTRIGVESPFGDTVDIPLPELYFTGGSNSHRGFSINQAGPRDLSSGSPVGGNAMIVNNLELRFPPSHLPWVGDNMSFVVFNDIGNVFGTADDMWQNIWRFRQRNITSTTDPNSCANENAVSCDFSYMSAAVGGGVRYHTPIGPVRVDFSYNVNPPVFPITCAGAEPGTCTQSTDQVRNFNFFFSIGQTF